MVNAQIRTTPAVWKHNGDAFDYLACNYGDAPPDVAGRDVVIVDFSFKRAVLEAMLESANSITVLDHHKTAQADLAPGGRFVACGNPFDVGHLQFKDRNHCSRHVAVLFDMSRSGAGIAWDFFHAEPRPRMVDHVEDRDLWRFALPFTREIHAAMSAYPFEFSSWDELAEKCERGELVAEGAAIDRKHLRDIDSLLKAGKYRMKIADFDVPVANLPVTMCSDAGNIMAKGEPFAATYYDNGERRCFSLRSSDAGIDVSEIAKLYGGGGHRNASGFAVPIIHLNADGSPSLPMFASN